jgi:4-carboxymuconolactone decarboxylase
MPPIPADRMTPEQRQAVEEIVAGPRGALIGPFIPALRSPAFMQRLQALGEYLRYEQVLEPRLREMVILMTARTWTQQFEWHVHHPLALRAGLPQAVTDAIAEGRRPGDMTEDEAVVHDVVTELERNRSVSDATYARAVTRFGEQGVVDLVGTVGYYSLLAMLMNVARTPLPAGAEPALAPLPG